MTNWTLLLCEGAHDQVAVVKLLCICRDWDLMKGVPNSLPPVLRSTYTEAERDETSGAWRFRQAPDYLVRNDRYLVVHNLVGDKNVLGQHAIDYLEMHNPSTVGVLVDANEVGVDRRVASYHDWYGRLYDHASTVRAGSISAGDPRLGLWVAPDNKKNGELCSLLVRAASLAKPRLVATGKRFATSLARIEPGECIKHRDKAVLGAIHQAVAPGASLASALNRSSCWIELSLNDVRPFKQLLEFLDLLTDTRVE